MTRANQQQQAHNSQQGVQQHRQLQHQNQNQHHHHHQHHRSHHHNGRQHLSSRNNAAHMRPVDLRIPAIEKYAYCLCLHVKPTTIFIGVFKLVRALIYVSILLDAEFSPINRANEFHRGSIEDRNLSTTVAMNILGRIITASVSAVGIYAVISGRAALLMPLYAMLLIEFFFALPTFYSRDYMDSTFSDGLSEFNRGGPSSVPTGAGLYPNHVTAEQYQRYSYILISTFTMIINVYFLCVIWKCYRYLRLIELLTPLRLSEIVSSRDHNRTNDPSGHAYPIARILAGNGRIIDVDQLDLHSNHSVAPPPYDSISSTLKPPNYEDAIKSSRMLISSSGSPADVGDQERQQEVVERLEGTLSPNQCDDDFNNITPPPQYAPPAQLHQENHHQQQAQQTLDSSRVQMSEFNYHSPDPMIENNRQESYLLEESDSDNKSQPVFGDLSANQQPADSTGLNRISSDNSMKQTDLQQQVGPITDTSTTQITDQAPNETSQ